MSPRRQRRRIDRGDRIGFAERATRAHRGRGHFPRRIAKALRAQISLSQDRSPQHQTGKGE